MLQAEPIWLSPPLKLETNESYFEFDVWRWISSTFATTYLVSETDRVLSLSSLVSNHSPSPHWLHQNPDFIST